MKVELTTMVMIENPDTGEVLVQNRTGKWPGWSFPGGKVDPNESLHDCAVREIKEETGLTITNLEYCGVVHWCNRDNNDRYIVFLYKTQSYSGELIPEFEKGQNFWHGKDVLLEAAPGKFSNERVRYIHLYFNDKFNEAYIPYRGEEFEVIYK